MVVFESFSDIKLYKNKIPKSKLYPSYKKKEINTEYKMNEADIITSERSGSERDGRIRPFVMT